MEAKNFEVIIIGGSYAGLSAAMTLGRSLRKTLVIDGGMPCNRFTPHSHNFLTQDGIAPGQIAETARQQVQNYESVEFLDDYATNAIPIGSSFQVETKSGQIFKADKLVFATGIKDMIPEIKGFSECWGKSIIHCPYCHGYEYRTQKTAIWVNEESTFHMVPLIRNLTSDLTILTNGKVKYSPDERASLDKNGIRIIEQEIGEIENADGQLQKVVFKDGSKESFSALYASLPFEQHCSIPAALGCELNDTGHIKVDMFFKTTVDGVYACGDNTGPFRSVSNAVANGNFAGAAINRELAMERFL